MNMNAIVCLEIQRYKNPPNCYSFDEYTQRTIATRLFPRQTFEESGYGTVWNDIRYYAPVVSGFSHNVQIPDRNLTYCVSVSVQEGDAPQMPLLRMDGYTVNSTSSG
ncbi:uncharacterized protein RSE6_02165 [Rhynchosporium secalis]|uniref:Uncharacterized protein n=1 Tax=Rhynchosporium secalis TaxID=38038 RepID=A0A1E1LZL0_RHYSE|nr:uncharacterized protein RSE6_02165 [Rhynchosporium secalis]